jgi:hypothetical protein
MRVGEVKLMKVGDWKNIKVNIKYDHSKQDQNTW